MTNHEKFTPPSPHEMTQAQRAWYSWLTGDRTMLPQSTFTALKIQQSVFKFLPANPRCEDCNAPFEGVGGMLVRSLGYRRSELSPHICGHCVDMIRHEQSGVEIPLAMLFADVRGSTSMAERMTPSEFQQIINRFYTETTNVLIDHRALIERLMGDQVTGHFVPRIAGPAYPTRAIQAARSLLNVTGHGSTDGPWIEVGVGVHVGIAYVGAVGSTERVSGITALGDDVNTAARLASHAATGEIVLSDAICETAGIDTTNLEARTLDLKGKAAPFPVHVIHISRSVQIG